MTIENARNPPRARDFVGHFIKEISCTDGLLRATVIKLLFISMKGGTDKNYAGECARGNTHST